ncbi:MAG TPA: PD-(D/E)XK nuclease family protein [Terracidiphilus sp.]|nr:PD-(D/E)XK nuclease family protein [Terracidiphilus sp.]
MGTSTGLEVDDWLRKGGIVVAGSDRAARALRSAFHRARQREKLEAWIEPGIHDWNAFLREQWPACAQDERLLMSAAQEEFLWSEIVLQGRHPATTLDGPRHRIASLAMEAHDLVASYAPQFLHTAARAAWESDSAVFSSWLDLFSDHCRDNSLLSPSQLPLAVIDRLRESGSGNRPPLLLVGFDRIRPVQRSVLDAWGTWREPAPGDHATSVRFFAAPDAQSELAACALWCKRRIEANPGARLLIVTQQIATRRGEMERALLRHLPYAGEPLFEFSLGTALIQAPLVKSAHLLLRWLTGPLEENDLDWLFSCGHIAVTPQEAAALQRLMRTLRDRGEARSQWTLETLGRHRRSSAILPAPWIARIDETQRRLSSATGRMRAPIDWAALVPQLLKAAGWPGFRPLASVDFQAAQKWQTSLESCASLGFDGRRMSWQEFFSALARILDQTLFAPESHEAQIQIAGAAESAGLTADGIWFLGAEEDAWPATGSTHPLLPLHVQRKAGMPHASPKVDWELGHAMTTRLRESAPEIAFSFAQQRDGVDARPSPLIRKLAEAEPLPPEFVAPPHPRPIAVAFNDEARIPFSPGTLRSGAKILTLQSQCPFKAFAVARLGAEGWEPAEAGLTAAQRGQLLHAVLHAMWSEPPPRGIRSLGDLLRLADRQAFVAAHVQRALLTEIPDGIRECMPRRYLELEEARLIRLVREWLDYEAARRPFTVADAESVRPIEIEGLSFNVRLDRIDRLNDGSLLVIDYKTGVVSPTLWDLPRPDDVQLPLYASFGLDAGEVVGGLVFARLRAGDLEFAGRVRSAAATLTDRLGSGSSLVKKPLTRRQLDDWKRCIEQLARDFLAGHAEADPRDFPGTCARCELPSLCRIHESRVFARDEESNGEEAADE